MTLQSLHTIYYLKLLEITRKNRLEIVHGIYIYFIRHNLLLFTLRGSIYVQMLTNV